MISSSPLYVIPLYSLFNLTASRALSPVFETLLGKTKRLFEKTSEPVLYSVCSSVVIVTGVSYVAFNSARLLPTKLAILAIQNVALSGFLKKPFHLSRDKPSFEDYLIDKYRLHNLKPKIKLVLVDFDNITSSIAMTLFVYKGAPPTLALSMVYALSTLGKTLTAALILSRQKANRG
ncbi:MAG: hypothetical protein ACOYK9_03895 [Chlamydiia bacterium]